MWFYMGMLAGVLFMAALMCFFAGGKGADG
jgi:hypothetical protein